MRLSALKYILILIISCGSAYAGEVQRVKLTDGSVMNVEVISMQNGVYTFKSASLGEFKVNARKVQSISSPSSSRMPAAQAGIADLNVNQLQSTLKANPEIMKSIAGLQNDPDFQAVLSDPEIMKAIQNRDYSALANNPKFQKLMNNPAMKQITDNVAH